MPKASTNVLATDKELKAAKAPLNGRRDFRIKGAPSLQLRVTDRGTKSWAVVYKRHLTGKWAKFVFGEYPALPMAEAKQRAEKLSVKIRDGFDPIIDKRRTAALGTFKELSDEYMREHGDRNSRNGIRSRSTEEAQRLLKQDILPVLGELRAELIRRQHVAQVVEVVAGRGAYVVADRVLGLVRAIFNWAVDAGRIDTNPTLGLKRRNASRAKERVLSVDEIRIFWNATDCLAGITPTVRDVLRLQLLTGLRVNEVAEAAISEIDFEMKLWIVPWFRTKNKREHHLPLSDFAIEILRGVIAREDAEAERRAGRYKIEPRRSELLFPSHKNANPRRVNRPVKGTRRVPDALDPHAPSRALVRARPKLKKLGIKEPFNTHDLRRSLATHAGDLNVFEKTIERILNHKPRTIAGKHYNHAKYRPQMREALEAWAAKVRGIVAEEVQEILAA